MNRPAPRTRATTRPATQDRQRVVLDMLAEDHRRVQEMFDEFAGIEDPEERRELVTTACAELTVHAQLEEELFYPAIREEVESGQLVDEAQVEHGVVKDLITQIEYTEPDDELYAAVFHVLAEYVNHHIAEEEEKIFPEIREAGLDLTALGGEMTERREELRAQHGLGEARDEDDDGEEDEDEASDDEDGGAGER